VNNEMVQAVKAVMDARDKIDSARFHLINAKYKENADEATLAALRIKVNEAYAAYEALGKE